jgi:hypothetical protein
MDPSVEVVYRQSVHNVREAVQLETSGKLQAAFEKYIIAIDGFQTVIAHENNSEKKKSLILEVSKYMDRYERQEQIERSS